MKTLKTTMLLVLVICFYSYTLQAQKMYRVHQDNVKPSMVTEYEKVAKEFHEACTAHNLNANWITTVTDDLKYLYVAPLENFAALDEPLFANMAESMGDKLGSMFGAMDKCYDSHGDYVIILDEDLSYMPEGMSQTQEGQNYRNFHYLYYSPENAQKLNDAMKAVKALFTSKNSTLHYRVYRSGFGVMESYYLVAVSSKDEVDSAMKGKSNDEVLGDERKEIFGNMMKYISNYDEVTGEMRPDLAYSSNE